VTDSEGPEVDPDTAVDESDPFAAVDRAAVAADHGLAGSDLDAALARVHEAVADYPGIADLVYEYRRAFRVDPLVARHGDSYYLLVPAHVWPEFADAADLSDAELAACEAVHARAFRASVGDGTGDPSVTNSIISQFDSGPVASLWSLICSLSAAR
jgi:hypothetical protein